MKIPSRISEYITARFKDDFLFEVKSIKTLGDESHFICTVSKDNDIHTLTFNRTGELIKEKVDQAFPPDIHEEPSFEDIPE